MHECKVNHLLVLILLPSHVIMYPHLEFLEALYDYYNSNVLVYSVRLLSQHSEIVCFSFQYINSSTVSVASSPLFTHNSLDTPAVRKSANDGPTLVFLVPEMHYPKLFATSTNVPSRKFIATPLGHLLGSSLSPCLFGQRGGSNLSRFADVDIVIVTGTEMHKAQEAAHT